MAEWKYEIGDKIIDEKRNLEIIDREFRIITPKNRNPQNQKWYKYKCNNCGYDEGWITQNNLSHGQGCCVCSSKKIVQGINDIYTLFPEKVKYFKNIEDTKTNGRGSRKYIDAICPICGYEREIRIDHLITLPFSCPKCGIHYSIPEKFVRNILDITNTDYIPQLNKTDFDWCKNFRYDFFITNKTTIIEVNGIQHYEERIFRNTDYNVIQQNDIEKEVLAKENGIKNYIIIKAIKTDEESLIKEIKESGLLNVLNKNISKRELKKCYKDAIEYSIKETCELFNEYKDNSNVVKIIAEKLNVSEVTVTRRLRQGAKIGLCEYDGRKYLMENIMKNAKNKSIPVILTDPNGKEYKFPSVAEIERQSVKIFGVCLKASILSNLKLGNYYSEVYKGFKIREDKGE